MARYPDNLVRLDDRRKDGRQAVTLQAQANHSVLGLLRFTVNDFSRTGAFLRRLTPDIPLPEVGDVLQLTLEWPLETQMPPVQVEAEVVRLDNNGIGVRFEFK